MKYLLLLLLFLLSAAPLAADGGRIRLHQQAGPFVVTLFSTPDPLVEGPADFSVAVERAGGQGLVEDAQVTLIFTQPEDPEGTRIVVPATHQAATSRFLQAANLQLPRSGSWLVEVIVSAGDQAGECSARVDVLPRTAFRNQTLWQILVVPLLMLLYLVHQRRKARSAKRLHRAHASLDGRAAS